MASRSAASSSTTPASPGRRSTATPAAMSSTSAADTARFVPRRRSPRAPAIPATTPSSVRTASFPNGGLAYFTVPTYPTTGAPPPPGVGRNSLRGPELLRHRHGCAEDIRHPQHPHLRRKRRPHHSRHVLQHLQPNQSHTVQHRRRQHTDQHGRQNQQFTLRPVSGALGARTIEFQARFSF